MTIERRGDAPEPRVSYEPPISYQPPPDSEGRDGHQSRPGHEPPIARQPIVARPAPAVRAELPRPRSEMGTASRRQAVAIERRRRPGRGLSGPLVIVVLAGLVIVGGIVLLPSMLGGVWRSLAEQNPDMMRLPFVADAVRDELGDRLDEPAGTDSTPVDFVIVGGTSARDITDQLVDRGFVTDRLAFSYVLIVDGAGSRLQAGRHVLNRTMSPRQVATALQLPPEPGPARLTVSLRTGLRLEQVTAYLVDRGSELSFEPADFYALASAPPADLIAGYPMLASLPAGRSLEGFLGSGVFEMRHDTDARGFLEILLERRQAELADLVGADPTAPLVDFYQVLTLASIVQREVTMPEENALVAGVYLTRLDAAKWPTRLLNADPTVLYGNDMVNLRAQPIPEWRSYVFWAPIGRPMADVAFPQDLVAYQSYRVRGLPPGPICSPTVAAIQAVLEPDTSGGYLYFVSKGDGFHAFARTFEEHQRNVNQYVRGGSPTP